MVNNGSAFAILATTLIGVAITIIVVQPYKEAFRVYNKLDAAMMLLLAAHFLGTSILINPLVGFHQLYILFSATLSMVPLVYISIIILRQFFPCQRMIQGFRLLQRLA